MKLFETAYSTFFNKCPRCHKGEVFKTKNPYQLSRLFSLHERCSNCDLKYEKEPSFFYGAMYVSYALATGWFILWYVLFLTVLNVEAMTFAIFIALSIILLSPLNLRWSRLIWLNFFFKYNRKYVVGQNAETAGDK